MFPFFAWTVVIPTSPPSVSTKGCGSKRRWRWSVSFLKGNVFKPPKPRRSSSLNSTQSSQIIDVRRRRQTSHADDESRRQGLHFGLFRDAGVKLSVFLTRQMREADTFQSAVCNDKGCSQIEVLVLSSPLTYIKFWCVLTVYWQQGFLFFTALHVSHPGPVSLHLNDSGFILFEWKCVQTHTKADSMELSMAAICRSVYVTHALPAFFAGHFQTFVEMKQPPI